MNMLSSSFASSSSDCNIAGTTSSNTTGITETGDVPCMRGKILIITIKLVYYNQASFLNCILR